MCVVWCGWAANKRDIRAFVCRKICYMVHYMECSSRKTYSSLESNNRHIVYDSLTLKLLWCKMCKCLYTACSANQIIHDQHIYRFDEKKRVEINWCVCVCVRALYVNLWLWVSNVLFFPCLICEGGGAIIEWEKEEGVYHICELNSEWNRFVAADIFYNIHTHTSDSRLKIE